MTLILAALLGAFFCLVGVAMIWAPGNAVQAFGVDPSHMAADIGLMPALGVRDIALGLIVFGLAVARQARATGAVLLALSLVPLGDFVVAAKSLGATAAVRHLIALPVTLILGLVLARRPT
ncbi:DUF4267 domain-containing protein [Rhodomicrobium vannielii ATCC 17100]|uniref:DUF4267 domain-containing protein n=1 Tax=Rhodomicrobium vannielii TaxID=1069 RepID=UPI00191B66DF|nr:DUF4267 domain-containing protein [Rhodomicrobium vannielii]MBJ7535110.1 DUF4267 domain-containing protein [Rhodomicrobium vannielii ATCC 17100]